MDLDSARNRTLNNLAQALILVLFVPLAGCSGTKPFGKTAASGDKPAALAAESKKPGSTAKSPSGASDWVSTGDDVSPAVASAPARRSGQEPAATAAVYRPKPQSAEARLVANESVPQAPQAAVESQPEPPATGRPRPSTAASIRRRGVTHADESNFETQVLRSETPVLVDFSATWCGPCKSLGPTLEQLAAETPQAKVVKIDIDECPKLAERYGVESIPHLIVIKQGRVVAKHTGVASKSRLKAMLDL